MKKERVFVIDYELLSPIAFGKELLNGNLQNDMKGEDLVSNFNTLGLAFKVGTEIKKDLSYLYQDEDDIIVEACKYDRKLELLIACYRLAEDRFKAITKTLQPQRGGCVIGVGSDVTKFDLFEKDLESIFKDLEEPYKELVLRNNVVQGSVNLIMNPSDIYAIYIAEKMKLAAFQKTTMTACTSSTQAIALAFDAVQMGSVDVAVTGGTDSIINSLALSSFGKLGVIQESKGENLPTCTPFDVNRRGTLAGEAAGLAVLASESYVLSNNLEPIAEILAYGNTLDGYKITAPDPSGEAMQSAIKTAIIKAGLTAADIDYIQAHGTATRHNDLIELEAIKKVFGKDAHKVLISSTKDRHGHAIGAAGIQELSILLNCMQNDFLPSNMNMVHPIDEEIQLLKHNKSIHIDYAMTNNFAFGGVNTVLVLKNLKK